MKSCDDCIRCTYCMDENDCNAVDLEPCDDYMTERDREGIEADVKYHRL